MIYHRCQEKDATYSLRRWSRGLSWSVGAAAIALAGAAVG